jgi:FkbM family methyltransferase
MMLDIENLYRKYCIPKKGVIHLGAWEGEEYETYLKIGVTKVLFVEANPEVFLRLSSRLAGKPNVILHQSAISDKTGLVDFHVTSMDQSSSILPLKHHKNVYPSIIETKKIQVQGFALDDLLVELKLDPSEFSFLNIDIQGAELLAFQGGRNVISKHIVAINTEVNYKEMYEGCALKSDVDLFLGQLGFICKETITPHPTWGDAFYVKI